MGIGGKSKLDPVAFIIPGNPWNFSLIPRFFLSVLSPLARSLSPFYFFFFVRSPPISLSLSRFLSCITYIYIYVYIRVLPGGHSWLSFTFAVIFIVVYNGQSLRVSMKCQPDGGIRTDDLFNETMLRISVRNIPALSFFFYRTGSIDRSRDDFSILVILRTVENERDRVI